MMHKKGFIHDDIKPGNILLDSDKEESLFPVISDFGNVKVLQSCEVVVGMDIVFCNGISLSFAAPEKLISYRDKKPLACTSKVDVFSFAMVFYEMLTRKHVSSNKLGIDNVIAGVRPELKFPVKLNKELEDKICDLINLCWKPNPEDRPDMDTIYMKLVSIWDV
jgi:serine/threonine protein kinase